MTLACSVRETCLASREANQFADSVLLILRYRVTSFGLCPIVGTGVRK
jgi:hypothetical protein